MPKVLTKTDQLRSKVINNLCFMVSMNSKVTPTDELHNGLSQMVDLLEQKQAKILSPRILKTDDTWLVTKTVDGKPAATGSVHEFATIVKEGEPYSKEIIDLYFDILRSTNIRETYEMLSKSRLKLNF